MSVYAYIRVSTEMQTYAGQDHEILQYCKSHGINVDKWISESVSGTVAVEKRLLGRQIRKMRKGDLLICTELSRLGRNMLMIMGILNTCAAKGVAIHTIKDNFDLTDNINSKIIAFAFALAAEIERKLTPDSSAVLVPMPRSRQALLDNGFDQGKTIGRRIASALGIEYAEAIKHRGSKKQKLLGYRDRLRNTKDAFTLDEKHTETVRGKRVILYDDIITTGASAAVCVKLMREAGATGVDFVSFARTER